MAALPRTKGDSSKCRHLFLSFLFLQLLPLGPCSHHLGLCLTPEIPAAMIASSTTATHADPIKGHRNVICVQSYLLCSKVDPRRHLLRLWGEAGPQSLTDKMATDKEHSTSASCLLKERNQKD